MYRFPDEPFAGAAFASDQHGGEDAGHFVDDVVHAVHGGAATEEAVNAASAEHLLGGGELADHGSPAAGTVDGEAEFLHIERLLKEVDGAVAEKLKSGGDLVAPAEGYDWRGEGQLRGHA